MLEYVSQSDDNWVGSAILMSTVWEGSPVSIAIKFDMASQYNHVRQ